MACFPRSWPGYETCPHPPDLRTLSPGSLSSSTARQPDPQTGPADREPGAGARAASMPATRNPAHQVIYADDRQLTALFAESGLTICDSTRTATSGAGVSGAQVLRALLG